MGNTDDNGADIRPADREIAVKNEHFHIDKPKLVQFLEKAPEGHLVRAMPAMNTTFEYMSAALSVMLARVHDKTELWEGHYKDWENFCETLTNRTMSTCYRLEANYRWFVETLDYSLDKFFDLYQDFGWQKLTTLRERKFRDTTLEEWLARIKDESLTLTQLRAALKEDSGEEARPKHLRGIIAEGEYEFILETMNMVLEITGEKRDLTKSGDFGQALLHLCERVRVLEQGNG